jgi:hypothetical protein
LTGTTPDVPGGAVTTPTIEPSAVESAVQSAVANTLAFTGANIWMLLGIAILLVLIGLALRSVRAIAAKSHAVPTDAVQTDAEALIAPPARQARNRIVVMGISLVLVFAALTGATRAEAAPMAVGVETPCSFLELANVVVSPSIDAGISPGPTYQILNVTVTNGSTFPTDITLRSIVSSDPVGAATAITLSGVHGSTAFYSKLLSDPSSSSVIHLASGESVQLNFTAEMAPNVSNAVQDAKISFDILVDAIEAT